MEVPIVSNSNCRKVYGSIITDNSMCAGPAGGGKGTCSVSGCCRAFCSSLIASSLEKHVQFNFVVFVVRSCAHMHRPLGSNQDHHENNEPMLRGVGYRRDLPFYPLNCLTNHSTAFWACDFWLQFINKGLPVWTPTHPSVNTTSVVASFPLKL